MLSAVVFVSVLPPKGTDTASSTLVPAYIDRDIFEDCGENEALFNAETGLHNGCVYLLHAKSETNMEMLGDLIDYIRGEGYEILRIDQP